MAFSTPLAGRVNALHAPAAFFSFSSRASFGRSTDPHYVQETSSSLNGRRCLKHREFRLFAGAADRRARPPRVDIVLPEERRRDVAAQAHPGPQGQRLADRARLPCAAATTAWAWTSKYCYLPASSTFMTGARVAGERRVACFHVKPPPVTNRRGGAELCRRARLPEQARARSWAAAGGQTWWAGSTADGRPGRAGAVRDQARVPGGDGPAYA